MICIQGSNVSAEKFKVFKVLLNGQTEKKREKEREKVNFKRHLGVVKFF